jgi:RNase adaptor protein for sRNA GlmZ degradation
VAIGCEDGHRSAQLSGAVAQLLRDSGQAVTVDHRDIDQAVVAR